jgi:hypothetical protein
MWFFFQLRLDFESFVITGPSTGSNTLAADGKATGGVVGAGASINRASKCLTDIFTVTNPGGTAPPAICGINTAQHSKILFNIFHTLCLTIRIFPVYVDAATACNELAFQLGTNAVDTTLSSRSWSIRVTQFDCGSNNLAPSGCTQWFYGQDTAVVTSYNWDGSYHLADQNQVACIRREKGNCRICYSTTAITDIQISGKLTDTAKLQNHNTTKVYRS